MDKTQLKRHDLVYPSSIGRARLKQVFLNELTGEKAFLAADIFRADSVIPGIVRRAEVLSADVIIKLRLYHSVEKFRLYRPGDCNRRYFNS